MSLHFPILQQKKSTRSLWIPSGNPRHKNSVTLRGFSSLAHSSGLAFLFLILSPWNDGWGQRRRGVGLLEIVLLESDRSVISVTITRDGWPGVMLPVLYCSVYCAHYTDIHHPLITLHCPRCHNTNVQSHQSRTQTPLSESTSLNIASGWAALDKCSTGIFQDSLHVGRCQLPVYRGD